MLESNPTLLLVVFLVFGSAAAITLAYLIIRLYDEYERIRDVKDRKILTEIDKRLRYDD